MRLFYYPGQLIAKVGRVTLYTEEVYGTLNDAERKNLRELDEEGIKEIGGRMCQFAQPVSEEERIKMAELYLLMSERVQNYPSERAKNYPLKQRLPPNSFED